MAIWCKAAVCDVSWSPDSHLIAAAGSKFVEIRDTLIGSLMVSIDLPKPLFYVSSDTDEARVGNRLKNLVKIHTKPDKGQRVESRVVEALNDAILELRFAPVSGLKNVLSSLIALVYAGYNYEHDRIDMGKLESRIRLFTGVVLKQIKEKKPNDVPRRVINHLVELTRRVQPRMVIPVADYRLFPKNDQDQHRNLPTEFVPGKIRTIGGGNRECESALGTGSVNFVFVHFGCHNPIHSKSGG